MSSHFLNPALIVALTLCSCTSADQSSRSAGDNAIATASSGRPLTQEQAWHLATKCHMKIADSGCGAIDLEKETATTWFYRVLEGYAAQPKGLIAVDKRTGQTTPLTDYPPGVH